MARVLHQPRSSIVSSLTLRIVAFRGCKPPPDPTSPSLREGGMPRAPRGGGLEMGNEEMCIDGGFVSGSMSHFFALRRRIGEAGK